MTQRLYSTGHLAEQLQRSVPEVLRLAAGIGAEPTLTLNGVPYFDAAVYGTLLARVNGWTDQPAYHRRFDQPEARPDA